MSSSAETERRLRNDRRARTLRSYWHGARYPRRRSGRRAADHVYPIIDWHPARVFALVLGILTLCVMDGILTVILIAEGAVEVNPLMALLVPHQLGWFAAIKLGLTSIGMVVLVACSRMQLFRTISGEALLAVVFGIYCTLIGYQLHMLQQAH